MEADEGDAPRAEDSVAQAADTQEPVAQSSARARQSAGQHVIYAAVGWLALDAVLTAMRYGTTGVGSLLPEECKAVCYISQTGPDAGYWLLLCHL